MKYALDSYKLAQLKLGLSLGVTALCSGCLYENDQSFGKLGSASPPSVATSNPTDSSQSETTVSSSATEPDSELESNSTAIPTMGADVNSSFEILPGSTSSTGSNSNSQANAGSGSADNMPIESSSGNVSNSISSDDDSDDSRDDDASTSGELYTSSPSGGGGRDHNESNEVPGFLSEAGHPVLDAAGNLFFENIFVGFEPVAVTVNSVRTIKIQFAALIEVGTQIFSKSGNQWNVLIENDGSFRSKMRCAMRPVEVSVDQDLSLLVNDHGSRKKVLMKWRVWRTNDPKFDPTSSMCGHSGESHVDTSDWNDSDSEQVWKKRGWSVIHKGRPLKNKCQN